eukprot:7938024-Alexandrium_andersonii.AAC.1
MEAIAAKLRTLQANKTALLAQSAAQARSAVAAGGVELDRALLSWDFLMSQLSDVVAGTAASSAALAHTAVGAGVAPAQAALIPPPATPARYNGAERSPSRSSHKGQRASPYDKPADGHVRKEGEAD